MQPYTASGNHLDGEPVFMNMDDQNLADSVDEVMLDDYQVGSILGFITCVALVLVFQVYGFMFAFIISDSHASRYGSIGGLGLLIAFGSLSLQKELEDAMRPDLKSMSPVISLVIGIAGYLLFIFCLSKYQRMRKVASSMASRHGTLATGAATFV